MIIKPAVARVKRPFIQYLMRVKIVLGEFNLRLPL